MQNIEEAKNQSKFFDKNLLFLIEKEVPAFLIKEIDSWPHNISKNQPQEFAENLKGKILSPKNYVLKLLTDYLTNNEKFAEVYEPNIYRPFLNFLLLKKLNINNKEGYEYYEFIELETNYYEYLVYIISLYLRLSHHNYPNKNCNLKILREKSKFGLFALDFYLNKNTVTFSKLQHVVDILKNPLLVGSLKKDDNKLIKYCNHLVPEAPLTDIYISGLFIIYF